MLGGGLLDLFAEYSSPEPRCVGRCPDGSVEVYGSCVAPDVKGLHREIAVTLHVPCSLCAADNGMDLASSLWFGLARLFHVPVTESVVSVLFMAPQLRGSFPLEHFALQRLGEAPLLGLAGSAQLGPAVGDWDFFVAVRIHTSRISAISGALQDLLAQKPADLMEVLGMSGIYIYEAAEQVVDQARDLSSLRATFKVAGLAWDEEPTVPVEEATTTSAALRGATTKASSATTSSKSLRTTLALLPDVSCVCEGWRLGDGKCDVSCNSQACGYDGGDCMAGGRAASTTRAADGGEERVPGSLTIVLTGEEKYYNIAGFAGQYTNLPLPGSADVFHGSESELYWQDDLSRWRFGPRSCADPSALSFGCGNWYVDVPGGRRQRYSSALRGNGLALTWQWQQVSDLMKSVSTTSAWRSWIVVDTSTTTTTTSAPALLSDASLASMGAPRVAAGHAPVTLTVRADGSGGEASPSSFRVVASSSAAGNSRTTWYADSGGQQVEDSSSSGLPLWLAGLGLSVSVCFLLVACYMAKRGCCCLLDNTEVIVEDKCGDAEGVFNAESTRAARGMERSGSAGWRAPSKDVSASATSWASYDDEDTESTTTGSTAAGTGSSDSYMPWARSPSHAKVHPEPDGAPTAFRASKGMWRSKSEPRRISPQAGRQQPAASTAGGAPPPPPAWEARCPAAVPSPGVRRPFA